MREKRQGTARVKMQAALQAVRMPRAPAMPLFRGSRADDGAAAATQMEEVCESLEICCRQNEAILEGDGAGQSDMRARSGPSVSGAAGMSSADWAHRTGTR